MRRLLVLPLLAACACSSKPAGTAPTRADTAVERRYDAVPRADFNTRALERALPLFWREDANNDGILQPEELAVLWGVGAKHSTYVAGGKLTEAFDAAYDTLKMPMVVTDARLRAVQADLARGRPSLIATDLRDADPAIKKAIEHLVAAAEVTERIYQKQQGVYGMDAKIPANDTLSRSLFHVNQGPNCTATGSGPECNALESHPANVVGLYPADLQTDKDFCDKLAKLPNGEELMQPFAVVVRDGDKLTTVPYGKHFAQDAADIVTELRAALEALGDKEPALAAYIKAVSEALVTDDWFSADEAWARMNADNSGWYFRLGPDEVYDEPCNRKAMFHTTLARVNPGSKAWQAKLTPLRTDMEKLAAELAGPPYKVRPVSFHMPEFIDVVVNAGDDRAPRGATVGQSLPNFGPVSEGRGRTVAMVNFYVDPDNRAALRRQASSLLCPETMSMFADTGDVDVMSTVLHEATHNFGPAQVYSVKGKSTAAAFGGPAATMLEELKAQTGAMIFTDWLVGRGQLDADTAKRSHVREVLWMFGHISRGMLDPEGKARPYSQLAAVQAGFLMREGVLKFDPQAKAANGEDVGCFTADVDTPAWDVAQRKLGKAVFGIKARNDIDGLASLKRDFVETTGPWKQSMDLVGERWRREPQATFVYALRLE